MYIEEKAGWKGDQPINQGLLGMRMLMMRVLVTLRTGGCAPHSAAWFTWVPATGLAQHHSSPKVACELPQFLRKGQRLIKIGQELAKAHPSGHRSCSPSSVFPVLYHLLMEMRWPCPPSRSV
jgi:hypothetical protein